MNIILIVGSSASSLAEILEIYAKNLEIDLIIINSQAPPPPPTIFFPEDIFLSVGKNSGYSLYEEFFKSKIEGYLSFLGYDKGKFEREEKYSRRRYYMKSAFTSSFVGNRRVKRGIYKIKICPA